MGSAEEQWEPFAWQPCAPACSWVLPAPQPCAPGCSLPRSCVRLQPGSMSVYRKPCLGAPVKAEEFVPEGLVALTQPRVAYCM